MNNIIKRIEIDLYSPTSYEVIHAQQGDNLSRSIEFVLYDQGMPYQIPENVTVFLEGHRGDNTFFEPKPCTISGNIITTVLDSDILFEAGTAEAKIVLYDSGHDTILSTIPFTISVQKHPCDKNKIESSKRSVIDWLTLNFEKLKKRMTSAESAIEEETRRASDAEETITENLNLEITRAAGKENEIADNLAKETKRASHAENELDIKKADLESPSLTGIPTAPTAPSGTNTGQLATTAFVHTAVSDGIAASDAMIFKGTIGTDGTVAALPSTYKTGWTYRVITNGTYAGEACETGDLIIALTDRDGSGNQNSDWCVAQTNIDGAITEINGTDGYISCTRSGSSVTVAHEDIEQTDTSSSQTISDKSVFSAVKSMTVDDKGHVTGVETEDITLDFSASGVVTGVKGDSETEYRGGNVSLSAEDTGALPISGGTMTGQIQIPSKALNYHEVKEVSNAAIGILRPDAPTAFFSVLADKTLNDYVWSLGTIADEVGFYGYTKDGTTPHWRFTIDAATGGVNIPGQTNVNGQVVCHGTYTSQTVNRFGSSALQIRENNLVGSSKSDIGYAPSIGFHWGNRTGGSLCLGSDAKFRFLNQAGNTGVLIANLEGNALGLQSYRQNENLYDSGTYVIRSRFFDKDATLESKFWLECQNGVASDTKSYETAVDYAAKCKKDGNGNVISDTYANKSIYGDTSVSMGRKSGTTVGENSFAFGGHSNTASGYHSAVLGGNSNEATNEDSSVLGGCGNEAKGMRSAILGGYSNTANGSYSAVLGGYRNTASNYASATCGKYNKPMTTGGSYNNQIGDAFVIGNGTSTSARSNALRVTYSGDVLGTKAFQSSGADYAEFIKPWADGNPDNEDRVGYFVTVKNGLLHKANDDDYITGITSGNPSVVGNADEDYYWRYERDELGRIVMEDVPETIQATDDDGNPLFDEETHEPIMEETGKIIPNARMKLSDDYDPSLQDSYIERKHRKEWDYVGMLGVLPVHDDGTCIPGQFCKCSQGGIATFAAKRGIDTYMVLERISDQIVSAILK